MRFQLELWEVIGLLLVSFAAGAIIAWLVDNHSVYFISIDVALALWLAWGAFRKK